MGVQVSHQGQRRRLTEDGNLVYTRESYQNMCPLLVGEQWPPRALEETHRRIVMQCHNQTVTKRTGLIFPFDANVQY